MTAKRSVYTTKEYERAAKSINAASQEIVKLINVIDTNQRDMRLIKELEVLREARYLIDHAFTLIAQANQIHYQMKIR